MDLCRDCDGLAVAISKRLDSWPGLDSFWNAARRRANSRDCRLCKMMTDYIFDNPDVNAPVPPTVTRIYYGPIDREGDALSWVRFLGVFGKPPLYYSEISVWSDPASPAAVSGNTCTLPQIASDNGPEAFALINSLLKTCLHEHESCKRTMSKALVDETSGPKLPTCVLDIGEINGEHIHLVETNGRHGNYCALSYLEDFQGWTDLLQKYSARQLTYKEDRLVAVEGLGRAIQEASHDKYSQGIFESTIPEQPLWMMEHRPDESDRLDTLPSWHWASTGGPKIFWRTQGAAWRMLHRQITRDASDILRVQGVLAKCEILDTRPSQVDPVEDEILSNLESTVQQSREDPLGWIQTSSRPARLAGIAMLDDEPFASAHILFLVQWEDYGKLMNTRSWFTFDDEVGVSKREITEMPYLVLLLRPSPTREGCFQRVGMGLVTLGPDSDGVSATLEDINLV